MRSLAKDPSGSGRINHNQIKNKHHTPGKIKNYLLFFVLLHKVEIYKNNIESFLCFHFVVYIFFILICYVKIFSLFFATIFFLILYFIRLYPVYGVCYFLWVRLILLEPERLARLASYSVLHTTLNCFFLRFYFVYCNICVLFE